jgi:large subunit ribosomal protein L9
MDVILLEKVENLGNIGDRVSVRSGYGRNYLLPKGKATLATAEHVAQFEARRAELESRQANELSAAHVRRAELERLTLMVKAKAGPEGKLFGSLGTIDIAEACTAAGVTVQRSEVRLPDGPIRLLGQHSIEIHLHTDLDVEIEITVVGDDISEEEIAVLKSLTDDAEASAQQTGDSPSAADQQD